MKITETKAKEFQPFTMNITVETKEELAILIGLFNIPVAEVIEVFNETNLLPNVDLPNTDNVERVMYNLYDYIETKATEIE